MFFDVLLHIVDPTHTTKNQRSVLQPRLSDLIQTEEPSDQEVEVLQRWSSVGMTYYIRWNTRQTDTMLVLSKGDSDLAETGF